MLRKEIEKIYSDIIADYFNKGYYINMNTMNGSQLNEIAKIDPLFYLCNFSFLKMKTRKNHF